MTVLFSNLQSLAGIVHTSVSQPSCKDFHHTSKTAHPDHVHLLVLLLDHQHEPVETQL